jgi:hypothetical protein
MESNNTRAEVKLLYPKNEVQVSLLDRNKFGLPDAIQVSLFNKDGKRLDLEVAAIASESLSAEMVNQRKYTGRMPSGYESYVGVAVKIPFTKNKSVTTLNSKK